MRTAALKLNISRIFVLMITVALSPNLMASEPLDLTAIEALKNTPEVASPQPTLVDKLKIPESLHSGIHHQIWAFSEDMRSHQINFELHSLRGRAALKYEGLFSAQLTYRASSQNLQLDMSKALNPKAEILFSHLAGKTDSLNLRYSW